MEQNFNVADFNAVETDGSNGGEAIFPINVHESLAASSGLKPSEKNGILISFWLFGSALLAWFLAGWLREITPDYYVLIVVLVEVALQLSVGTLILRIVLDERTIISEANSADNNFAKYFKVYHEHLYDGTSSTPFDMIEFDDGSYAVYLQFLFGYNTTSASQSTYEANQEVQRLINRSGMAHKRVYINERFSNSEAAQELRDTVSGIEEPTLFKVYRDIVHGLITIANEQSNVPACIYVIYAKTKIQKDDLKQLVQNIMSIVGSEETSYREVSTMSYQEIIEFYRIYNNLDVLDMGMVRAHTVDKKKLSCSVRLLKVYGKSGKSYSTPRYDSLGANIMADNGLVQINEKR